MSAGEPRLQVRVLRRGGAAGRLHSRLAHCPRRHACAFFVFMLQPYTPCGWRGLQRQLLPAAPTAAGRGALGEPYAPWFAASGPLCTESGPCGLNAAAAGPPTPASRATNRRPGCHPGFRCCQRAEVGFFRLPGVATKNRCTPRHETSALPCCRLSDEMSSNNCAAASQSIATGRGCQPPGSKRCSAQ